jgi:hypothetical protein
MLAACATENLYEGFKAREAMRDPIAQPAVAPVLPSFRDYESERARMLDPSRP